MSDDGVAVAGASSILKGAAKPGVVDLGGIDDMEERMRALAAAQALPTGSSDLTKAELAMLARQTPAQLLALGSERSGLGVAQGPPDLQSPSASYAVGQKAKDTPEQSSTSAHGTGGARRAVEGSTSDRDITAVEPSRPRARRRSGGGAFGVRIPVQDKPGLLLASAGTESAEEAAADAAKAGVLAAMGRPRHARASMGSTGAAAMAEAIEAIGGGRDMTAEQAAEAAEAAYRASRQASRAESPRGVAGTGKGSTVAPLDTGKPGFSTGALRDSKGGPDDGGGRPSTARTRLQMAGRRVQDANRVAKVVPEVDPKCLLSKDSSMMRSWDLLMIILLVYTALLTPFEVSFVDSQLLDTWFWVNRVVDLGFLLDLFFNFFLPFYDPATRREVKNHRAIAVHYLRGWFSVDILSIFPFDIVFESSTGESQAASTLQLVRVIRLLKLAKLLRVVRASRIVKRWRTRVGLSFSLVQLISFLVYVLLLAHWSACGFYLVGTLTMNEAAGVTSWVVDENVIGKPYDAYIASLYFSTMTTTTIGYGDIVPFNSGERLFTVFLMILGGALYAYVIGAIGTIVANFDGATSEHRANMDQLNRYTNELDLPQALREELREYFAQTLSIQRERYYSHLLSFMSPKLRGHVAMHRHGEWITHVPFFNASNAHERIAFVTAVAMELQPAVFGKLERVMYAGQTINRMYIIQTGLATVQGRIVQRGHFFGEEAILTQARAISTVRALTYLDVFFLTKESLNRILDSGDFSETRKKIRYAVIRMALRRELLKCAAMARIANGLFRIAQGGELAYAPDPSADLQLERDAEDEESLLQATSVPTPSGERGKASTAVGRPPSPPRQPLLALARDASRQRAILGVAAGGGPRTPGAASAAEAAAAFEEAEAAASSGRRSSLGRGRASVQRASSGAPSTGREGSLMRDMTELRAGAGGRSGVSSGGVTPGRPALAAPTFGAQPSPAEEVGFAGPGVHDSKRVPPSTAPSRGGAGEAVSAADVGAAGSLSAPRAADGAERQSSPAGRGRPSGMSSAGHLSLTAAQREEYAREARRMERYMPPLARHMSRARLDHPPPSVMSRAPTGLFTRPGQSLGRLSAAESVGPFALAASPGDAATSDAGIRPDSGRDKPGTAPSVSDYGEASGGGAPSGKRRSYERGILQRVLTRATKAEAQATETSIEVGAMAAQMKLMQKTLTAAASGVRTAQVIAAFASLMSCVLLGVLLSRP